MLTCRSHLLSGFGLTRSVSACAGKDGNLDSETCKREHLIESLVPLVNYLPVVLVLLAFFLRIRVRYEISSVDTDRHVCVKSLPSTTRESVNRKMVSQVACEWKSLAWARIEATRSITFPFSLLLSVICSNPGCENSLFQTFEITIHSSMQKRGKPQPRVRIQQLFHS
jgi:hypothetical protein